jgi:hypothetical protein
MTEAAPTAYEAAYCPRCGTETAGVDVLGDDAA